MVDIAENDDATSREIQWQLTYYDKWGEFPNKRLQSAQDTLLQHPSLRNAHDLITDRRSYDRLEQQSGKEAADRAMKRGLGTLVAQEVVKASLGGSRRAGGRAAIAASLIQEAGSLVASRGGGLSKNGVKMIGTLPAIISSAAGELVGGGKRNGVKKLGESLQLQSASAAGEMVGDGIARLADVDNQHAKNALQAVGSIAGGAIAGAAVGGPAGAAVGAAVAAVSWGVGHGIKALAQARADGSHGTGSTDNWCYVQIGDIGESRLCMGTHAGKGSMHWRTFWKEYGKSHTSREMSAAQKPTAAFQLCVWEGRRIIHHFNVVYYRDMFGIIKRNGKYRVVHCKGPSHGKDAGKVECFET